MGTAENLPAIFRHGVQSIAREASAAGGGHLVPGKLVWYESGHLARRCSNSFNKATKMLAPQSYRFKNGGIHAWHLQIGTVEGNKEQCAV